VHEPGFGEREQAGAGHEDGLGGLLDSPHVGGEGEAPREREDAPDLGCRGCRLEPGQIRDRGLERCDLAEVHEPGASADGAGEERRAGPRAPDHEDHPALQRADGAAQGEAAPPDYATGRAELQGG
jgi:hypothetical protein